MLGLDYSALLNIGMKLEISPLPKGEGTRNPDPLSLGRRVGDEGNS